MRYSKNFVSVCVRQSFQCPNLLAIVLFVSFLFNSAPAMAHHAMGGRIPTNFWQGLLSGLAHPIIGPDHFAFIVSVGLLAALRQQGIWIPVAFVLAAMLGTGFHLVQAAIPGVEFFVSGSILLFGILLVMKDRLSTATVAGLAALAGMFHGYAYGEAIFGAQMVPLLAYLIGFSVTQLVIAMGLFWIGKVMLRRSSHQSVAVDIRPAGWALCGMGVAFLVNLF
jgi:urease accessory protein